MPQFHCIHFFCQVTGFGGTTKRRRGVATLTQDGIDLNHPITIEFTADVAGGMKWSFEPIQSHMQIFPGETTLAVYRTTNNSDTPMTGIATYNVTPMKVGQYFNKVECFCFDEQRLEPGEEVDMPLLFFIDPSFSNDPKMDNVDHIILSYTFFQSDEYVQ
eukprot:TRINITY_DN4827_c0_g1_i1.p2 TRINITY_DN4827_c0_g1~~TRINITY_DN4827_c0_g1_i1.p2  ORF type:complete len:160 (-),score=41.04 TRINITY_DN4827_c0_g1_i1:32-511(-)